MKKLMIAAAIVCAAAFAQAAAIQWQISGIADAPGSTSGGVAGGNYYAYIFLTDGAEMNDTTTLEDVLAAFKDGNYPEDALPVNYSEVTGSGVTALALEDLDVTGASTGSPVTLSAMAVIFDSWESDPSDEEVPVWSKYQVLAKDFEFLEDGTLTDSSVAANDWQAVPEPTTGLLMLVGLAGLALKRKRA